MALTISCPTEPSATGAYRVSWSGHAGQRVELTENGVALSTGGDDATTVSGRLAGRYTYHLEAGAEQAVCDVVVEPPSMTLAASLFGLGGAVFLATVALIVLGHRRHRRELAARSESHG